MITENAKKMVDRNEQFRGFYTIYALKHDNGRTLKVFFRPTGKTLFGIERQARVLRNFYDMGFVIDDVTYVTKTEWYTARLDFDVEQYKEVDKTMQELEDEYALGRIDPLHYAMFKNAFRGAKSNLLKSITRGVSHLEVEEIPIKNELAIELVNFKESL